MSDDGNDLRTIVTDLVHTDDCSLDHHGYCQAHLWFGERECPHARGRRLLERLDTQWAHLKTLMEPNKVHVTWAESSACAVAADPTSPGCEAWERGVTDDDWRCASHVCPYRDDAHEVGA